MKQAEMLKERIMSDRYNAMIFKTGEKHGVYLVGGYIRDLLRGVNAQDRDFLISRHMKAFLAKIRISIPGKSIVFRNGNITRFVTRNGMYFDFSPVSGTLREDLSLRDFSINAIAWSPDEGILDFHKGLTDLREKRVRTLSVQNLLADPLRMLRAYRFSAELGGVIEANTKKIIKTFHNSIQYSSPERITLELFSLLNHDHAAKYLKRAFSDGILNDLFQINSKTLKVNIQSVSEFEKSLGMATFQRLKEKLKNTYSQNLTYKGLLCLEMIASDFHELVTSKLRISRRIRKRLFLFSRGKELLVEKGIKDREKIFNLFFHAKEAACDLLLTYNMLSYIKDYERYIRIWKGGNIKTDLIKEISGIEDGKPLGDLVYEIRRAEFKGEIKTKQDAHKFIMERMNKSIC